MSAFKSRRPINERGSPAGQVVAGSIVFGDVIQISDVAGDVIINQARPAYQLQLVTSAGASTDGDRVYSQSPSYLLDAARQVVGFHGRETELHDLVAWRDASAGRSLRLVSGPAGQGKTRLAMEFMRQCHAAGWVVVSATELDGMRSAYPDSASSAISRQLDADAPVLVIVDYADRWLFDTLISLVRDLDYSLTRRRLRILLLARPPQTLWESVGAELDRGPQLADPLMLGPLDGVDARAAAFRSAVAAFRTALAAPSDVTVEPPDDLTHPGYGNLLTLHMAALVRLYATMEHTAVPAREALSLYLLRHERRYWERMCRSYARDGRHDPVSVDTVANAVLLATLFGPLPVEQVCTMLASTGLARDSARARAALILHGDLYPAQSAGSVFDPLRPDRLGEDFVASVLTKADGDGWRMVKCEITRLLDNRGSVGALPGPATRRFLNVVSAASADDRHPQLRTLLFELLAEAPAVVGFVGPTSLQFLVDAAPIELLLTIESHLPSDAPEIVRPAANLARRLLDEAPPDVSPESLAWRHDNLSVALGNAGDLAGAIRHSRIAVRAFNDLAHSDMRHLTHHAAALNNLSAALYDRGALTEALEVSKNAVTIARALTDRGLAERALLAATLGTLSAAQEKRGDHRAALAAAEEAAQVLRRAVADDQARLPDLAGALDRWGMKQREVNDLQQAIALVREAVDILGPLHDIDPARFQLDFARASLNLAQCLSDLGDHAAAMTHAVRAVEVYRRLARLEPVAYANLLGRALRGLGAVFFNAGELRLAQPVVREAVAILRHLAEMDARAYGAELANSLANLSTVLSDLDDMAGALAAAMEAAHRFQEYAGDRDVILDHQRALVNLGKCQAAVDDLVAASATTRRAVNELRRLSSRDADVYEPTLAAALNNLGTWLYRSGEYGDALAVVGEAVEIRRRLAAREPDAHLGDLAATLRLLVVVTAYRHSSPEPALEPARESVVTARHAAQMRSTVHEAGLVESLEILARTCDVAGEFVEGRAAAEAALKLTLRLAGKRPDLFAVKLTDVQAVLDRLLRRAATSPEEPQGLAAVTATEQAVDVLGRDGIVAIAAQLWPVDCQGCGQSLAGTTPALHVETIANVAVSLYHPDCESALAASGLYAIIPSPTWRSAAFLLQMHDQEPDWPIVVLNPSLERVVIERIAPEQWRVVPDGCARGVGLMATGQQLMIRNDRPLRGSAALFTSDGTIAIGLGGETYEAPLTEAFGAGVRHLSGLLLVVSHATWPSDIVSSDHFRDLLRSDSAAAGWVPLREPSACAE